MCITLKLGLDRQLNSTSDALMFAQLWCFVFFKHLRIFRGKRSGGKQVFFNSGPPKVCFLILDLDNYHFVLKACHLRECSQFTYYIITWGEEGGLAHDYA